MSCKSYLWPFSFLLPLPLPFPASFPKSLTDLFLGVLVGAFLGAFGDEFSFSLFSAQDVSGGRSKSLAGDSPSLDWCGTSQLDQK